MDNLTPQELEELLLLRRLWKSDALDYEGEQRYITLNELYNRKNSIHFICNQEEDHNEEKT